MGTIYEYASEGHKVGNIEDVENIPRAVGTKQDSVESCVHLRGRQETQSYFLERISIELL